MRSHGLVTSLVDAGLRIALVVGPILVLIACSAPRPAPAPSVAENAAAAAAVRTLERDLEALRFLPTGQRQLAEQAFGERLQRDLQTCQGSRHENWPLYYLAVWTLTNDGVGAAERALAMLDRLERLPADAFRGYGRVQRVTALLRLGRLTEARQLAQRVEDELPQTGAMRRVEFHELVGRPAMELPGVVAGNSLQSDAAYLICFVGAPDESTNLWLEPYRAAIAGTRIRMVAVVTAGDALAASSAANSWQCEVRWARHDDPNIINAWRVPGVPIAMLVSQGPHRTIQAADPRPAELGVFARSH